MFARFVIVFIGFTFSFEALAQTLTISSAANSGSYSYNAGTLTVSGTSNIQATQIQTWLGQGDLSIVGSTTALIVNVNQAISSSAASNLTIGALANTGDITLASSITLGNALTIYGNSITLNVGVNLHSSSTTGHISLLAKNGFSSVNDAFQRRNITTNGGNINIDAGIGTMQICYLTINPLAGNISLKSNLLSWPADTADKRPWLNGSGPISIEANGQGISTVWYEIDQDGLGFGGLTIGNLANNQTITLHKDFTVAGPVNLYGHTVTLSGNLTTTYNGNISIYSDNALGLAANRNITAAGVFTYAPRTTSFAAALSYPIANLTLNANGLTLGKPGNVSEITIASSTSVAGSVTLYGSNINLNQNINTTGAAALGDVLCKASGEINLAASKSITTSGGDVILWANSDNANSTGSVALRSGSSIVTGSNSVTGGHVWIGGGSDGGTWNGLSVGAGYAVPGPGFMPTNGGGPWAAGVFFESCSITTFGGDVKILGDAASSGRGLICFGSVSIQTNAGDIEIEGNATNSALGNVSGILFGLHDNFTLGNVSLSSSASGTAIKVSGFGRGSENAIGLSGTLTALSTGTGNIVFNGTSYGTGTAINIGNYYNGILNAYAASGSITFNGGVKGLQVSVAQISGLTTGSSKLNIGQGGGIGSSTSAVILTGDALSIAAGGIAVNTSGPLTIQPSSDSFTNALTYPITGLTVANTITGLTLGKSGNAAGMTISSAQSIPGPITIYGGALTLSAALSTTNTTSGNLSLNGTTLSGGSLSVANGRTLTFNLSSNTTYAGAITGTGLNVIKDGAGILTLTASNTPNFATLTISGGTYRLNSNQQLTLSGALTNNGTFAMSDGATFKQATTGTSITGTGTYVVEKALTGNSATWNTTTSGRFWYMGVPMNSVARSSFGNYDLNTNRLFSYSENTKQYTNITDNAELLSKGTGYVHRRSTDGTLTFSAAGSSGLYGEDLTLSGLTRTSGASVGFHLISNPYMGYLDWHAITKNNVESTYYIRSNNAGSDISALITYNGSNQQLTHNTGLTLTAGQMQYLAPLQAVWVRVGPNSGTGTLAMTRSMVSHQSGNTGLKTSTIFPTLARVNLVDGARFDQMLVFMNQDMSNGVDEYDSEKMFVSGNPQIYTMAAGKKLVMNGLNSNKKKISVPLYLELPESKVYNLQLADYNLEDGLILLEDKLEGTIQDFTIHDTYAFYANSGVLQNRFVLHFYMPDATITAQGPSNSWVAEEGSYTEGGNILISSDPKGKVQISLDQPETEKVEGTVQVSDANGRVVYVGMLEGLTTEFQLNVPSGIYYLTAQSGNIIENKKVFIQE